MESESQKERERQIKKMNTMDDTQRIVKCGNLSLHSPGNFFKRRWLSRYLVLYDGSKSGVKRLELFESEIKFKKQIPAKIIPLVDCVRVVTCQRQRTTYTFEVRTSDQFYLLASQSFQDMNDWVNCLRQVAFADSSLSSILAGRGPASTVGLPQLQPTVDVLLDKRLPTGSAPSVPIQTHPSLGSTNRIISSRQVSVSASQAASAAAVALARTRQRQPSLLGACKPQPPKESPLLLANRSLGASESLNTMTPTVRGQLIAIASTSGDKEKEVDSQSSTSPAFASSDNTTTTGSVIKSPIRASNIGLSSSASKNLDEEEENMLYCSIEDNPSERNYRVKVIETELSLRCQLKCYQLTTASAVNQQYEQLGIARSPMVNATSQQQQVTFYQLIIGPQQLTLLNDYACSLRLAAQQQQQQSQGLWSWPYQCIRRYGFDKDNCFMFEAGRKCSSGPGQFVVQSPKAYNIYQDVVRFVNELRSLAGPSSSNSVQQLSVMDEPKEVKPVVTQIPVSWAPSTAPSSANREEPTGSKTGFFSALRQLEAKTGAVSAKSEASSAPVRLQEISLPTDNKPEIQGSLGDKTKVSEERTASEETDESGYEQGDESVDGTGKNSSRTKLSNSKSSADRTPGDSISSASSLSSHESTSPAHSLSGSNKLASNKQPARPNSRQTGNKSKDGFSSGNSRLGVLLNNLADSRDDFETSLIRDVYSEISKLHAKFAVTSSGSADDSLSSNSSNEESNGPELDRESPEQFSASSSQLSGASSNLECMRTVPQTDSVEPMYSNLRLSEIGRSKIKPPHVRSRRHLNEPEQRHSKQQEGDNNQHKYGNSSISNNNHENKFDFHNQVKPYLQQRQPQQKQNHRSGWNDQIKDNSYAMPHEPFEYLSLPNSGPTGIPLYPTLLNPIPECTELVSSPSSLHSARFRTQIGSSARTSLNRTESINNDRLNSPLVEAPISTTKAAAAAAIPTSHPSRQALIKANQIRVSPSSGPELSRYKKSLTPTERQQTSMAENSLKSKLPTNHYVINDVQYAKISRNISSNFEASL